MIKKRKCSPIALLIIAALIMAIYMSNAWIARRSAFFDDYLIHEVKIVQNLAFFILAVVFSKKPPSDKLMVALSASTFAVWIAAFLFVGSIDPESTLILAFKIFLGIFEGLLNALMMTYSVWLIARADSRFGAASIAAAFLVIEAMFDSALAWNAATIFVIRILFATIAVVATLCLYFTTELDTSAKASGHPDTNRDKLDFWAIFIIAFVVSFAFGFIRQCFSSAGRSDGLHNATNGILMIAILIISIGYYLLRGNRDLHLVYAGSVGVFIVGLAALPVLLEQNPDLSGSLIKCAWALFQPLVYISAVKSASRESDRAFWHIGMLLGSLNSGVILGLLGAMGLKSATDAGTGVVYIVSMLLTAAIALCFIASTFLYRQHASVAKASTHTHADNPLRDPFISKLTVFSADKGLTNRETEILIEASHGFSVENIARKLFCSPETVRTHLKSIYGKAGVTSKQDLLERIDAIEIEAK